MIKARQVLSFLLAFTIVLISSIALAQDPPPPPPDYFPLVVNDWWKYQSTTSTGSKSEFTMTVLNTEKASDDTTLYKVEIKSALASHQWYSKPNGWVLWHKEEYPSNNQQVDYKPAREYLKNPLSEGDKWQWEGKGMMGIDIKESNEVMGVEEVEVPAGKFRAFKVVTELVQGGTALKKTIWYANYIGSVKSVIEGNSFQATTELIDYSFKRR